MSFFQDVPPPLDDDKPREVDEFDIEDDNSSRISADLPEISNTNFDVYNSSSLKPPELSAALFFDEPPPDDDYDPTKVSREDSFEDFVYHQHDLPSNESIEGHLNSVIEDHVGKVTIEDVIDDSPVEFKLSQLEDLRIHQEISPNEKEDCSRTLDISKEHEQGLGKLILSPDEPNFNESFDMEDPVEPPPLDSPVKETFNSMESDNGAISSFSTSLTCNDDNINENLHKEFTDDGNYSEVITFNETLQHSGEIDINHVDDDIFKSKISQDVIEPTQLEDDDDDDFNDFEAAIPIHRTIETQSSVVVDTPTEEVRFEADFSAFSEPVDFADNNDDDDDFGDFNDFETAPIATATNIAQEKHSIEFVAPSNVKGLLGDMFPSDEVRCEENEMSEVKYECYANNMKCDDIVKKLDDFDATFALGYLYNNSSSSQILVKALGIDTRNILLGPQWGNSSSSSMPRFASNLSFNPLEPLKPMSNASSNSLNKSDLNDGKILAPQASRPDIIAAVPEVQFDWNSSGLVNPLDGKQPNAQQSNVDESKVQSTAVFTPTSPVTVTPQPAIGKFESKPTSYAVDEEEMTHAEVVESSIGPSGNDLDVNLSKFSSWEPPSFQAPANSILVRERTIKLPETHIFTPVKSTSPVAREVISRDGSPSAIVVKEYHDIEYLEPKRKPDLENDFDDFQSAPVEPPSLGILEPQKVENQKSSTISWPNPGEIIEDFSFMEMPNNSKPSVDTKPIENTTIELKPAFNITAAKPVIKRELPVIGNSPSKHLPANEDDDFADFQAAPVISMPNQSIKVSESAYQNSGEILTIQTPNVTSNMPKCFNQIDSKPVVSSEQLTLSPSKLVSTMNNRGMSQKSSWITSMDNDEINRIEAAFPKCKVSPKQQTKANEADDDDWSDFVGVQTTQQHHSQSQNVSNSNHQKSDEWSDFVSAPPSAPIVTVNSISSQISKPNFTSWNQPVGKPYVHHATSFLTSEPKNLNSAGYQYSASNQRSGVNITNNFNYQQNGISTILPELDFAMPRMNLPRSSSGGGGASSSGKK